ncbi:MAG: hypothetical protein JWN14_4455 [Chthonomonadales bacterium]|nr:hypothetical protein [Chthonomonadales bacterium]
MLRQPLSSKNMGLVLGGVLLLCLLIDIGFHLQQNRTVDSQEAKMVWQRDREMGVPDTGLGENASPEERQQARTRALEEKMTQDRSGVTTISQ